MEVLFYWLIVLGIYFIPTFQAINSHKKNKGAIFALNLLLGWTIIGYIVALIWSLTKD
ncbi:superinfection immunity protein [Candidatus Falkowbacteria bacterium]|nr:superinfection immunity protein [Candidatus Falkowbacteria bacterium]